MKTLYGKCGCNCGHCPAYIGNARTKKDRQRCSNGWHTYLGAKLNPARCVCLGCQAKDPWKSGNILPDRGCYVRPCVLRSGIKHCAYCSWFPCEDLKKRIPDRTFRKKVEKRMGQRMSDEDYQRFIQPYEGVGNLRNGHDRSEDLKARNRTMGAWGDRNMRSSIALTSQPACTISIVGNITANGLASRCLRSRNRLTAVSLRASTSN